jgi:DNA polymerase
VFGEGAVGGLLLVGEQPGDVEDRAGRPFVGPAGRLLRELLAEAEVGEDRVYLTNAVKHFKWRPGGKAPIEETPDTASARFRGGRGREAARAGSRSAKTGGKRRIHDRPSWSEITACGHWLGLELRAARPALVVCLGATAAQALFGRTARVGALRGQELELEGGVPALVTVHPSAVLRAGDQREVRRAELLEDLRRARALLDRPALEGAD